MVIRKATQEEYGVVRDFYYCLIDDMEHFTYHPKWQKGIYPEDSYLEESIRRGEMMIVLDRGRIIGAMIINHSPNDGYRGAPWQVDAPDDRVLLIHALGVAVNRMRTGVGRAMVQEAIRLARDGQQKAIRLDVLAGNDPAARLYEGQGFRLIQRVNMFYEDTGWCDFDLYEYVCSEQ